MARRYELTDVEWGLVEPHLPPPCRGRPPPHAQRRPVLGEHRHPVAGDLPERFGPWQTVYERFRRWRDDGTWGRLLGHLQRQADRAGLVDWSLFCVDSTTVRARRSAAGGGKTGPAGEPADHALGRSRGGFSTKVHLVTDGGGLPLAVLVTAGQVHESKLLESALGAVRVRRPGWGRPRCRPAAVAGDKGYSHPRIRRYLRSRGIRAVIPCRPTRGRATGG